MTTSYSLSTTNKDLESQTTHFKSTPHFKRKTQLSDSKCVNHLKMWLGASEKIKMTVSFWEVFRGEKEDRCQCIPIFVWALGPGLWGVGPVSHLIHGTQTRYCRVLYVDIVQILYGYTAEYCNVKTTKNKSRGILALWGRDKLVKSEWF